MPLPQNKGQRVTGPYLDGGGVDETSVLDIIHDLCIMLKGLQKGATRFGNGTLLTFLLQVIHNDIVILLSSLGRAKTHTKTGPMLTF